MTVVTNDTVCGNQNCTIYPSHPDPLPYVISLCVIMLTSLIGNALILAVVWINVNGKMQIMSNYLIVNMSVSDLLITICNIPNAIDVALSDRVSEFKVGGAIGLILCGFVQFVWLVSFNVSFLSLVAIAVDRFLGVFVPFVSQRKPRLTITLIWLLSIAFPTPLIAATRLHQPKDRLLCSIRTELIFTDFSDYQKYISAYYALFTAFPLIAITILYSAIMIVLTKHNEVLEHISVADRERREMQNRRVLAMLITVVMVFTVCVVPFWTAAFVCVVAEDRCPSLHVFDVIEAMAFLSCALTPCVYFIFGENFRVGGRTILEAMMKLCNRCRAEEDHECMKDQSTKSTGASDKNSYEMEPI